MKASRQERILASAVFNKDMEVGRQEGHQLQNELDLGGKRSELKNSVNSSSLLLISLVCINRTFE